MTITAPSPAETPTITGDYTLAQAIRDGSKMSGQAFRTIEDAQGNTCALGAALKAIAARHFI